MLSIAKDFIISCVWTWYWKNWKNTIFKAVRQHDVQQISPLCKNFTAETCDTYWKCSLGDSMDVYHKINWPCYYRLFLWIFESTVWHFWCPTPWTACTRCMRPHFFIFSDCNVYLSSCNTCLHNILDQIICFFSTKGRQSYVQHLLVFFLFI